MSAVLIVLMICVTSICVVSMVVSLVLVLRKIPPTERQFAAAERKRILEEARAAVIPHVDDSFPDTRKQALAMLREYDEKLIDLTNEQLEEAEDEERRRGA